MLLPYAYSCLQTLRAMRQNVRDRRQAAAAERVESVQTETVVVESAHVMVVVVRQEAVEGFNMRVSLLNDTIAGGILAVPDCSQSGQVFQNFGLHRLAIKLDTTVLRLWTQSSNVWPFCAVHAWVLARRSCLWMVSGSFKLCGRAKNMD